MNKSLRKAIIAGNWKMNKTRPEAKELLEAIKPLVANADGTKPRYRRSWANPMVRATLSLPPETPTMILSPGEIIS